MIHKLSSQTFCIALGKCTIIYLAAHADKVKSKVRRIYIALYNAIRVSLKG